MDREWRIEPLDTLFFRGGMPFGKGETGWLESIFPPTPQTIQGFIRSAIVLDHCKSDKIFACSSCSDKISCELPQAIGSTKELDYGTLDIYSAYLYKEDKRYYPVPADLVKDKQGMLILVPPDIPVRCDIGNVRLPASDREFIKPVEGWISEDNLKNYLQENIPSDEKDILKTDSFFEKEPKVGIERIYETHNVKKGMLYSIVSLRFNKGVEIRFRVNKIKKELEPETPRAIKFGGEGKVVKLSITDYPIDTNDRIAATGNIKMVFLQPADFDGKWYPCDFTETIDDKGAACWTGQIQGVNLKLISACTGKAQKIGGFDMVRKENKPMRSYVPAGSVYYFEVTGGVPSNMDVEGKIGLNNQIGFGHYMLGRW